MESCSRTQKQLQPGTWFSSRAFKKREGAREKHLNFKKNVKESSTEDEYSMSSETSELEISREFPLPKMMILGVCFVTGNFRRIVRGNFGSCAVCAHCGPMWIVLGLKRTCISAIFVAKQFNSVIHFLYLLEYILYLFLKSKTVIVILHLYFETRICFL